MAPPCQAIPAPERGEKCAMDSAMARIQGKASTATHADEFVQDQQGRAQRNGHIGDVESREVPGNIGARKAQWKSRKSTT